MSRLSLAQQLKQLEEDTPRSIDPESAYTSLDGLNIPTREGDEGREHYLDVGPSKLRAQREEVGQTLLGDKYAGATRGRVKIFDDDDEEEDEEEDDAEEDDEDEDDEDDLSEDGEEDEEQGSEDDEDNDAEEDEEEEEDEEDDEQEDAGVEADVPVVKTAVASSSRTSKALDPMGSLKEARQKDVQKGKGIKKQKALFDSLITLRITFQKALTASTSLPYPIPADPAGEVEEQRLRALRSLADLNERLLDLRTKLVLSGTEIPQLGKRKRGDEDPDEAYWVQAAKDSFALSDANHPQVLGILHKWSAKINAASLAVTSKAAGSSKFLQSTKGQLSIEDAIQAGITNRVESDKTFMESEEAGYRLLLKEVIESRSGGAGGADLTHLRREKKKKREAERGGSKGRKLKYTVHEKAQNFMVPLPLSHGWHDEQIDELFSSLLGGAGMRGAGAETAVNASGMINGDEGLASLGGLRVF